MELEKNYLYFDHYYGRCHIIDFETCFLNGFSMDCVMFKNEKSVVPFVLDKKTFVTRFEQVMKYIYFYDNKITKKYYKNDEEFTKHHKKAKDYRKMISTAKPVVI